MESTVGRTQQYCHHCGARLRTDNAFCVSCGENLSSHATSRGGDVTKNFSARSQTRDRTKRDDGRDITPHILVAVIAMITGYLAIRYSVFLGFVFIILAILAVGWFRRSRGAQTEFEKRVFEKLPTYREQARRATGEAASRYREWDQARIARLREEAEARATRQEEGKYQAELGRYKTLFQRAYKSSAYFLDWWRAYADEGAKESSRIPGHLDNLRRRAEAGLQKVEEVEASFSRYSGTDDFAENAKLHLNNLKVGQENFGGEETLFTPIAAVHDRVKEMEGWERFQEEFQRFVRDLEDLLESPVVKTEAANRVRFPGPAGYRQAANPQCPKCGKENMQEANFCLGCGAALSTGAGRGRASGIAGQSAYSSSSGDWFVVLSIPFAVVALFFLPPVFGGIGVFLGYKAKQEGSEAGGVTMMVVNGACLLFGMLSGFLYWGF